MSKLILYAPNIHTGGGKTLLIGLLKALESKDCLLILDRRLDYSSIKNTVLEKVNSTFISRFKAEVTLKNNSEAGDIILCFHSMPPIFKSKAKVIVYFHNKKLISSLKLVFNENFRAIFRVTIERLLSRIFYKNVDQYLVQSQSMKRSLDSYYSKKMCLVSVCPFTDIIDNSFQQNFALKQEFDFIYISMGLRHKNHSNLLKAWVLLAEYGVFPKLTLTLSTEDSDNINIINKLATLKHLNVENIGWIDNLEILKVYSNAKALIFPSLLESFGLPLVEAKNIGLPILASELDYVRDVCNPSETFDPTSHVSIARSVMRFLKLKKIEDPIVSSEEFIGKLFNSIEN